jgi:hypothetical protein
MRCDQGPASLILLGLWAITAGLLWWTVRLCSGA